MLADVHDRREGVPFVPFIIRTSDAGPAVFLGPIHINGIIDQETNGE